MSSINQDQMMYGSWDIKCKRQILLSLCHFLPFDSPNNPKNQNFEKIKKPLHILSFYTCEPQLTITLCIVSEISSATDGTFWKKRTKSPGDIINIHICTINKNHMIYDYWNMECNWQIFFSVWIIFCPFTLFCHIGPFFALLPL